MTATDAGAARPAPRLAWRLAEVVEVVVETPRARSLVLRVPDWPGHAPGQHVDVRLTAEDGYQAQRSYSIASPPERPEVVLTVERIDDGEVSPFLADDARPGDRIELRGPIGGYFTWTADEREPLQLVAGGSGMVPLMAMLRHRALAGADRVPARLLYSSRTWDSRSTERRSAGWRATTRGCRWSTRSRAPRRRAGRVRLGASTGRCSRTTSSRPRRHPEHTSAGRRRSSRPWPRCSSTSAIRRVA